MRLAVGTSRTQFPASSAKTNFRLFAQGNSLKRSLGCIVIARPAIAYGSRTEINGCEPPMRSRLQRINIRQGRALYHQARQSACCIGAGVDIDTVSSDLDFEAGRVAMYDCLAKILV